MKKLIVFIALIAIYGCALNEWTEARDDAHPVATIDENIARNCTYLYSTALTDTGYTPANATANAVNQLIDEVTISINVLTCK